MRNLFITVCLVILSGCTSITSQLMPIADRELLDPDMALVIVKRTVEESRSAVLVEITDNGNPVGSSGVNRQNGQSNNWLIWERPAGEMELLAVPKFGVADQPPIVVNVEIGKTYEYTIKDHWLSGLLLEK